MANVVVKAVEGRDLAGFPDFEWFVIKDDLNGELCIRTPKKARDSVKRPEFQPITAPHPLRPINSERHSLSWTLFENTGKIGRNARTLQLGS